MLSFFFFSSRRRHTRSLRDWSSDVCSSDLALLAAVLGSLSRAVYTYVRSAWEGQDRKSTRLNSSHVEISYAVFCLKQKKKKKIDYTSQKKKTNKKNKLK